MSKKYSVIYGVDCRDVRILSTDKQGAWISYKVKSGRKVHKCWIDLDMIGNSPVLYDLYKDFTS